MEEIRKKAGRKPKDAEEKKTNRITILANDEFYKKILDFADKNNISVSAFITMAITKAMNVEEIK